MKPFLLLTSGQGLWSSAQKAVRVTDLQLSYVSDDQDFGELRVYFDPAQWDVNQVGLIYTDPKFLAGLQIRLSRQGLSGADVGYSEQGMQGDDYVSLDVGAEFVASWCAQHDIGQLLVD